MIGEKLQSKRKTHIGIGIIIGLLVSVAGCAIYEATKPYPTTPTPTLPPAIWEKKGYGVNLTIMVKNDTDSEPYQMRTIWKECNQYNFTVEIKVVFNGSDCIVIRQVDVTLERTKERTSYIKNVMLCDYNVTLSSEFKFSFHPKEVKIPFETFDLVIEVYIDEFYQEEWKHHRFEERITITVHS